jgi:hypothetical protein
LARASGIATPTRADLADRSEVPVPTFSDTNAEGVATRA